MKETLLPRGFLPPPRHGFDNRAHHPTRRRSTLRLHPESLDSNHRLSPHSLHKTMSGHGGTGHSGRPGPKNPEFANSASSGGDEKAPHPPGAMKRGLSATSKPVRPSVPAGMDGGHSQSPIDQWIMGAHRSRAGGQPQRNPKRNKVDYFASAPQEDRVVPDCWEDEVLIDTPDAGSPGAPSTDKAAIDGSDGAVAEGQSALPPSEDMGDGQPVSQGLTTGFWLPGERPTQPSRPQAPPRPLGEPQMPGRGLSQNNSGNVAFL